MKKFRKDFKGVKKMLTLRNEHFIRFANEFDMGTLIIRAEIDIDTADELPEADSISGKILHQGSTALIIKEGRFAILSGDGHWYINGEMIK